MNGIYHLQNRLSALETQVTKLSRHDTFDGREMRLHVNELNDVKRKVDFLEESRDQQREICHGTAIRAKKNYDKIKELKATIANLEAENSTLKGQFTDLMNRVEMLEKANQERQAL